MKANIGNGIVAGFVATVVLSALMLVKGMMGLMPNLDVVQMLSSMAHADMGTPALPVVGWVLHFMIGSFAWGGAFAVLYARIPGDSALAKGMIFGSAAWLLMMVMVMPMAGAGFFGLSLGIMAPVATLMLHWVLGAALGLTYAKLAGA